MCFGCCRHRINETPPKCERAEEFRDNDVAIFESDLSPLKPECVCLANTWGWGLEGGVGTPEGRRPKKTKPKQNKTTKENYILKTRMKAIATSKVNWVTEL